MSSLKPSAFVFALHACAQDPPEKQLFGRFYESTLDLLTRYGMTPTYLAAEGSGYSGEYSKFGGRANKRLTTNKFGGVSVLSLAVNPLGSDEPSYDAFASVSLSYTPSRREVTVSWVVNEAIVSLTEDHFQCVLTTFLNLCKWYGGYAFTDQVSKQPELFVVGLDSGKLSSEELRGLHAWYSAPVEHRMERLRNVYPYNLINDGQLSRVIDTGITLGSFITRYAPELERVKSDGLYLWKVGAGSIANVRSRLRGCGVLFED